MAEAFVLAQKNGKQAYENVIKAFYVDRRVARIVHDRARAMHCLDDKEEVMQQVAILLSEKLLDQLCSRPNPPTAIYTLISTTAHFVCQTLMKQNIRSSERQISLHPGETLDHHFETLGVSSTEADVSQEVLDRVDRLNAQVEFNRRKALLMEKAPPGHPSSVHFLDQAGFGEPVEMPPNKKFIKGVSNGVLVKRVAQRKPREKFDPDGQAKLIKVREELHLTNQELADALGLRLATLSSYVYGRVDAGVPIAHVEAAQALLANSEATIRERQQLVNKSQGDVIADWERSLGIHGRGDCDHILAELLEVNQVTVWRWKKVDGTRLSPVALSNHTKTIQRVIAGGWTAPAASVHNLPMQQIFDSWCRSLGVQDRRDRAQIVADCIGLQPWEVAEMLVPGSPRPSFRFIDDCFRRVQAATIDSVQLVPLIDPTGMKGSQLVAAFEKALKLEPKSAAADRTIRSITRISPKALVQVRELKQPPDQHKARTWAALVNDRIRSVQRTPAR